MAKDTELDGAIAAIGGGDNPRQLKKVGRKPPPASVVEARPKWSGGKKRIAASERRAALRTMAAQRSSRQAGEIVRQLRERMHWTKIQLAAALELSSSNYLGDIEAGRMRKTPAGDWKPVGGSLQLLHEIALETGCDIEVRVVERQPGGGVLGRKEKTGA